MLVIRLSRSGKSKQASYRMVVAEKSAPVKGNFVELVGFYNPSENKRIEFKKDRIEYWISVGAKPSDTLASLLKINGMSGMEEFIGRRNLKRPKKNPSEAELAAMEAAKAPTPPAQSAPAQSAPAEEPNNDEQVASEDQTPSAES